MTKYRVQFRNTSLGETTWATYRGSSKAAVKAKVEKILRDWFNVPSRALPRHIKIVDITEIEGK